MNNLVVADEARDFFLWADPTDFVVPHQIGLIGCFTSTPVDARQPTPMFLPNPECRTFISPFQNNLLRSYVAEYNLELARERSFPRYSSRLHAIFLLDSEIDAEASAKRHADHVGKRILKRGLRPARARGYLTKRELEAICYWKSPRAIRYIQTNTSSQVRGATKRALGFRSELARLEALCSLNVVSVPMASAILMLLYPRRYGVIDIRVWQLLHTVGSVTKAPSGAGFSFNNWDQFLMIIRYFAQNHGVKARDIERTLFLLHRHFQDGRLYRSKRHATAV